MSSFSVFDQYEDLTVLSSAYLSFLASLKSVCSQLTSSVISELFSKFSEIQQKSDQLIDGLLCGFLQEKQKSERLFKKLVRAQSKANQYLTLHQEQSCRVKKAKLTNKSLTSSVKKLKRIIKHDVKNLEASLKKQQKTHSKLSSEYNSSLEAIEKEFTMALELPILDNKEISVDTSREFDNLMQDLSLVQEVPIDNSRISMEKNMGEWNSDYESDNEKKCETDDIKKAIKVLIRANLIGESDQLGSLVEMMNSNRHSESIELIRQLIDIKQAKNQEIYEDTTPMNSIVMNDNKIIQTLVSPGHRGPIFFGSSDFEQDSIL
jgi:hypothetical protein